MKRCIRCGCEKSDLEFSPDKNYTDGRKGKCKKCLAEYARNLRLANAEYRQRQKLNHKKWNQEHRVQKRILGWKSHLKHRYGITPEQHSKMYANQDGRCAICRGAIVYKETVTDHCHSTGKVRGLLCQRCNILVGQVENGRHLLPAVFEYLNQ